MAHKQLLVNMGIRIQFPGNHCLEYQDKEMIGKCRMRVKATSAFSPIVDADCAAFKLPATDMVTGIITTLSPKWTNAIIRMYRNLYNLLESQYFLRSFS